MIWTSTRTIYRKSLISKSKRLLLLTSRLFSLRNNCLNRKITMKSCNHYSIQSMMTIIKGFNSLNIICFYLIRNVKSKNFIWKIFKLRMTKFKLNMKGPSRSSRYWARRKILQLRKTKRLKFIMKNWSKKIVKYRINSPRWRKPPKIFGEKIR